MINSAISRPLHAHKFLGAHRGCMGSYTSDGHAIPAIFMQAPLPSPYIFPVPGPCWPSDVNAFQALAVMQYFQQLHIGHQFAQASWHALLNYITYEHANMLLNALRSSTGDPQMSSSRRSRCFWVVPSASKSAHSLVDMVMAFFAVCFGCQLM